MTEHQIVSDETLKHAQRAMLDAEYNYNSDAYRMTTEQFNCFVHLIHELEQSGLSVSLPSLQEIAEKDARIERLEALLRPFAKEAGEYAETWPDGMRSKPTKFNLGDLRRARAALSNTETNNG